MTITQQPAPVSLSMNLLPFVVQSSSQVAFKLRQSAGTFSYGYASVSSLPLLNLIRTGQAKNPDISVDYPDTPDDAYQDDPDADFPDLPNPDEDWNEGGGGDGSGDNDDDDNTTDDPLN